MTKPRWEVYKRQHNVPARLVTVTIGRSGALLLSQAAFDALARPRRAELLYDLKAEVIGIRPTDDPGGFVVSRNSRSMSARGFVEYYGITHRSMRFDAHIVGVVLCVPVAEPGYPVTSGARKDSRQ